MSPGKFFMFRGFVLFCALLSAGAFSVHAPYAQNAPAASVSVSVKMIDLADSGSDPAGKQYRASVTKLVSAGNGAAVPAGSAAIVTLAQTPNGWAAQLSSLTIAGQAVPVTSVSANVTSSAQSTAASAANTVGSVLGGFGHRASPPAAVTAVASGQRVILPPGVTITFVLAAPPSPAAAPAAPDAAPAPPPPPEAAAAPTTRSPIPAPTAATAAAPARAPIPAPASSSAAPARSAIPAPTTASSSAGASGNSSGGLTAMEICFSNPPPNPSDLNHKTEFLTAAFEVPVENLKAVPVIEPAFSAYLKATYQYPSAGITCQPIWSITDAQAAQKKIANDRDTAKLKMVATGWRYGQPPLVAGQSGFDPLAQGPGGLDLSQHRLTTYFCSVTAAATDPLYSNHVTYVSSIFQADWDSAAVSMAYNVFIRDQYVHDLSLTDLSPRCLAQNPAMQAMLHQTAMISNKRTGRSVPVDWTYTPAQGAVAHVAAAQAASATAATASANGPPSGGPFISCSTSGGAGIDTYLTGVFQTTHPVRHMPSGGNLVDQGILDRFYAYLTQKGYNFKPGSNYGCDVSPTEAAAKAAQHKRAYEGGACSTCGKIVETGWKDTQ